MRAADQLVPEQRVGERVVGEVPGRADGPGDLAEPARSRDPLDANEWQEGQ